MNRRKREQLIFDAAVSVFSRQGYPNTSVSEIIDQAQVARGTFYLYFKSKKDLLHALIDRFLTDISRDVSKIRFDGALDENGLSAIRRSASDLVATLTSNKPLTRLLLMEAHLLDSEANAKVGHFADQLSSLVRQRLEILVQQGALRPCSTDVAARCLIGSVREIVSHWLSHETMEMEPAIEGVIDYLLHGLVLPPAIEVAATLEEASKTAPRTLNNFH